MESTIQSVAGRSDIVIFPGSSLVSPLLFTISSDQKELFLTGYTVFSFAKILELAETSDGASFQVVSSLAQKYNVSIVYGYPEISKEGLIYDSAQLVGPQGHYLVNYRKVHLADGEDVFFNRGFHSLASSVESQF